MATTMMGTIKQKLAVQQKLEEEKYERDAQRCEMEA